MQMSLVFSFISVLLFSIIVLIEQTSFFIIIVGIVILLATNFRLFWLITLPTLIVQSGFAKTVYFDRDLTFISLFDVALIPDLWLVVFAVRSLCYLLNVYFKNEALKINYRCYFLLFYISVSLVVGTFFFIEASEPLFTLNKAPIKLFLFVVFSCLIFNEVKGRGKFVVNGFVFSTIIGALLRVFIVIGSDVKDPGIYTFVGVFVSSFMFIHANKLNGIIASFIPKHKVFWGLVLLLHFSVSRTEMLLFIISSLILFFSLKGGVLKKCRDILITFPIFIGFFIIFLFSAPENISNYFFHKLSFFYSFQEGVKLGHSASVRIYTFLNLLYGYTGTALNNVFGYGVLGYVNFDSYYTSSISTEGAFSNEELISNKFFKLHFFLNNLIFYFGFIGVFIYVYTFYFFYQNYNSSLRIILILYAFLNCFFRLELIVIFPVVIAVFCNPELLLSTNNKSNRGYL